MLECWNVGIQPDGWQGWIFGMLDYEKRPGPVMMGSKDAMIASLSGCRALRLVPAWPDHRLFW
jgi:hypothetical protein